jgi:DNA repair protein RadC
MEVFSILMLNNSMELIGWEKLGKGTINEAVVYPRQVVQVCLNYNASNVILAHNHPGGTLKFSSADIAVTKKLKETLANININVIDHIISDCIGGTLSLASIGGM